MIKGLLFDKDGTLFDFNATWGAWTRQMLQAEAQDDPALLQRLAKVLGYDLQTGLFVPGSIVIAETQAVVVEHMAQHLPGSTIEALGARMNAAAADVTQTEAVPLQAYFTGLKQDGFTLGIATNDSDATARVHLENAGITGCFDFIAGYDTGHGAKPGTGQLDAFCAQTGLEPAQCAMVGDSLHDLHAGRAAGMTTIGVLTGPAPADELAPMADVVLPDIAGIPGWLRSR